MKKTLLTIFYIGIIVLNILVVIFNEHSCIFETTFIIWATVYGIKLIVELWVKEYDINLVITNKTENTSDEQEQEK